MGLRLYGLTVADMNAVLPEGVELATFRELAAVVEEAPFENIQPDGESLERYTEVIETVFEHGPIVPAPPGTVFRDGSVLVRWMEPHYVALTDALSYVEDRAVARVHMCRGDGDPAERDKGADLAAGAAESYRALRRRSVAAVPLKTEHLTGIVLSGAFLVERELWGEFEATLRDERQRNAGLRMDLTGPWPPYDFVRMQFGG